eukprot:10647599-Ditylum_brightwellii.AAC.1
MKQVKINSMRHELRNKFGIRIPKDHHEAFKFDKKLGNSLWKEATKVEMDKTYEKMPPLTLGIRDNAQ